MENMKNAELLQAYADNYSKLANKEITVEASKKIMKELDKFQKQKGKLLKDIHKKLKSPTTQDERDEIQKQLDNF